MFRLKTSTMALTFVGLMTSCTSMKQSLTSYPLEIKPIQATVHGQDNATAYYQLGRYYQGQMRYEQAVDAYRGALAQQPKNVDALTGLGVALAGQGQYDNALAALKGAAALAPNETYTLGNLGYLHWLRGEREQSMSAYRQALRVDPLNDRIRQNLRMVMREAENGPRIASLPAEDGHANSIAPVPQYEIHTRTATLSLNQVAPQVYELTLPKTGAKPASTRTVVENAVPEVASVLLPVNSPSSRQVEVVQELLRVAADGNEEEGKKTLYEVTVKPVANVAGGTAQTEAAESGKVVQVTQATAVAADVFVPTASRVLAPSQEERLMQANASTNVRTDLVSANDVFARTQGSVDAVATAASPKQNQMVGETAGHLARAVTDAGNSGGTGGTHSVDAVSQAVPSRSTDTVAARPATMAVWQVVAPSTLANEQPSKLSPPKMPPTLEMNANIEVLNGNGMRGIAGQVSGVLASQGFSIGVIGDHRHHNEPVTHIEYPHGYAKQAQRLKALLPPSTVLSEQAGVNGNASIRLVLGRDIRNEPTLAALAGPPVRQAGPVGVANGNGVKGMASRVASYLASRGYRNTSVYDLRPFNRSATRIEYRKGFAAEALRLGEVLPVKVAYVESSRLPSDVRLVLGHDMKRNMTAWAPWLMKMRLADASGKRGGS